MRPNNMRHPERNETQCSVVEGSAYHSFRAFTRRRRSFGSNRVAILLRLTTLFLCIFIVSDTFAKDRSLEEQPVKKNKIQYVQLPIGLSVATAKKNIFPHPLLEKPNFSTGLVLRPLTAFDENRQVVCKLCKDLPQQIDDKTWQITLRQNIFWGDETPVTTADLMLTWQVGLTQNIAAYQNIENMVAKDDRTVRLTWKTVPHNPQDLSFFWPIASHVERFALKKPTLYKTNSRYTLNRYDAGLYNGPYIPENIQENEARFVRNPAWKGRYLAIDEITVKALPDTEALAKEFVAKKEAAFVKFDYAADALKYKDRRKIAKPPKPPVFLGTALLLPGEISLQQLLNNPNVFEALPNPKTESRIIYLESTGDMPPALKAALLKALDRQKILDQGLQNKLMIADTVFPALEDDNDTTIVEKTVEELMQEAGFEKNSGIWQKDGQVLKIGFALERNKQWRSLMQQFITSYWREAGFVVKIITDDKTLPANQLAGNVNYNLSLRTYAVPETVDPKTFQNIDKRVIPLYFEPTIYGYTGRLQDVKITTSPISLWAEDWLIKRPLRFE